MSNPKIKLLNHNTTSGTVEIKMRPNVSIKIIIKFDEPVSYIGETEKNLSKFKNNASVSTKYNGPTNKIRVLAGDKVFETNSGSVYAHIAAAAWAVFEPNDEPFKRPITGTALSDVEATIGGMFKIQLA